MTEQPKTVLTIAAGKSIITSTSRHLKPGVVIPEDDPEKLATMGLSPESLAAMAKKGITTRVVLGFEGVPSQRVQKIENQQPETVADEDDDSDTAGVLLPPPTPAPRKGAPQGEAPGVWAYDPSTLKGMDLVGLNSLIIAQDPSVKEFRTREEAIAFASQDFKSNAQVAN
jgi:hypothetical protein